MNTAKITIELTVLENLTFYGDNKVTFDLPIEPHAEIYRIHTDAEKAWRYADAKITKIGV